MTKKSMNSQLDYLDQVAKQIARGEFHAYGPLSSGERVYAALAANRSDLLQEDGYTIAQALDCLGEEWLVELLQRWRYVDHYQLKEAPARISAN